MYLTECTVQMDCLGNCCNPMMTATEKKVMRRPKNMKTESTTCTVLSTWQTITMPCIEQFLLTLTLEKIMVHPYVVPELQANEPNYDVILRSITAVKVET